MTIAQTAPRILKEAGNGVKVKFDFVWKIFTATDLTVFKVDAAGVFSAVLTLGVDYTVAFDAVGETGSVTYVVAPVSGGFGVILGDVVPDTQASVFPREGKTPADTFRDAYDKLTVLMQQLVERVSRAALLPSTPTGQDQTEITERIDGRAVKWFKNLTTGKFEMKASSSDPDDITGTAVASGLASARPVAPTNSILHWYSTDEDQYDVWLLAAGKWFDAVG